MTNKSVDELTNLLDLLDLEQSAETAALQQKHRAERSKLIAKFKTPKQPTAVYQEPRVLSKSKKPLRRGDKVIVQTTTKIGSKGDTATVLFVSAPRIDIHVHRVNDTTWRAAHNLKHYH